MNTFFGIIQNNVAMLSEEESLHCIKVLRHKVGDIIQVIDGNGLQAIGKIEAAHSKQCAVSLTSKIIVPKNRDYYLHIAIAPTKNIERLEWFVEKAVEIGIDEITFLKCKNSERTVVKDDRTRKVAESAVKQSKSAYLPKLNSVTDFNLFIKSAIADVKFIAHCEESIKHDLKEYAIDKKSVLILIGPEGDFNKDEIALATKNEFKSLAFGKSRLRTETAGVYACCALAVLS